MVGNGRVSYTRLYSRTKRQIEVPTLTPNVVIGLMARSSNLDRLYPELSESINTKGFSHILVDDKSLDKHSIQGPQRQGELGVKIFQAM